MHRIASTTRRLAAALAAAGILGLAACGGEDTPEAEAPPPAARAPAEPEPAQPEAAASGAPAEATRQAAVEIFQTRCTTCHGAGGTGDGPGSAALDPKPRNFQDAEWQASVTDEHIHNIILYGGAAVGRSPAMPSNPDLVAKPEVVDALVAHLRSLGRG